MYQIYQVQYLHSHRPAFGATKQCNQRAGQFIESQTVSQNRMESLKCASIVLHIRIYRSYSSNSESVTQLIQKKISK